MPNCVVNGCTPKSREWETGVILHTFPKNKDLIRKWLQATGQQYEDLEKEIDKIHDSKSHAYRMCSLHFSDDYYLTNPITGKKKLMPIAVPSIFQPQVTGDKVAEEYFIWNAAKKRCLDVAGIPSAQFVPGELCPTCRHVIPHAAPDPSAARRKFVDRGTSFENSWGTKSKAVQATVRMFSTRIQCTRLRDRRVTRPRYTDTPFIISTPQRATEHTEDSSSEETEDSEDSSPEETEEEEETPERASITHSLPRDKPSFSTITPRTYSRKKGSSFYISRAEGSTFTKGVPSQKVRLLPTYTMAKEILTLILEIIYLLTGEDYTVVNKSGECVTTRPMMPPPETLIHPKDNEQKILEVVNKILKILTAEIVKAEDTEGDEEYYEENPPCKEEEMPTYISTDGTYRSHTPQRRPSHLHGFTLDDRENNQIAEHIIVKAEKTEGDEEYYRGDPPCKEEETPTDIRTDGTYRRHTPQGRPSHLHGFTLDDREKNQIAEHIIVKAEKTEGDEEYYRGDLPCKEEETPTDIRTGE